MNLAAADNMIFPSRIRQTAQLLNIHVGGVEPDRIEKRVKRSPVRAVILDLNYGSGSVLTVIGA